MASYTSGIALNWTGDMLAIVLIVFSAVYLGAFLFFLGRRKPGYSHVRDTISELGEVGAPHQRLVAVGVFFPVGMAALVVTYMTLPFAFGSAILAACIAAGYLVAALFPCDVGSPFSGTNRQAVHNLGGAVEYIGGALALFRIAGHLGQPFQAAGFIVVAAAVAISLPVFASIRGLVQRIAELCLFGGLALSIWRVAGHSSH